MDESKGKTSISMGLDAIFSANSVSPGEKSSDQGNSIIHVDVSQVVPSPYQARKFFSDGELLELSESINQHGVLQPVLVRKIDSGFELISGERRLRASKLSGLTTIPAVLFDINPETAMAFGLIENIQRENLNVIEESDAYFRLLSEFCLSHEQLALKVGKSRSHITNILRLRDLSEVAKNAVISGKITMGHARSLLTLPENEQLSLVEEVIEKGLSVRETENLVASIKRGASREKATEFLKHERSNEWAGLLSDKLSTKVDIKVNQNGEGKITLHFSSSDEIDWLIEHIQEGRRL